MELSLDEIIQQKKASGGSVSGNAGLSRRFNTKKPNAQPMRKTLNRPIFKETTRLTDARVKIIQKNRARIVDARDKLGEITRASGDARQRLTQRKQYSGAYLDRNGGGGGGAYYRSNGLSTRKAAVVPTRRVDGMDLPIRKVSNLRSNGASFGRKNNETRLPEAPRGYVDYDNMEQMEQEEYNYANQLHRTVRNDVSSYDYDTYGAVHSDSIPPPAPRRLNTWASSAESFDPFDVYELNKGRAERRMSPSPPPVPKGILRSSRHHSPIEDMYARRFLPEAASHLSYEMRSRLEHAPDPHASMGIFSNPLSPSSHHNPSGYRIVVSNLHASVTQTDIKELFSDIGPLYDSRIVRPGVAEVIYKTLLDAENAVETYHNRQLDGQPMKCLLVNPRVNDKPTAPAIKTLSSSSRSSGKTPLEIDIDALHKVLFRRN